MSAATVKQIVDLAVGLTADELRDTIKSLVAVSNAYAGLENARAAHRFGVGDSVSFAGRHGRTETGTIQKVNRTTVIVQTPTMRWSVHARLLRPARAPITLRPAKYGDEE